MKNATISKMILERIAQGLTVAQAIDAVLGAGTHEAIVNDLYAAFTNKGE